MQNDKSGAPPLRILHSSFLAFRFSFVRFLLKTLRRQAAIWIIALPLTACLLFQAAIRWWSYPEGIERPPAAGTFLEDRNGVPLAALVAGDDQWHLPLSQDQINPHLFAAIVAVEDSRFYQHAGVDWKSAAGALWQDVRHLGICRGGSTLTMQLQRLRELRPRTVLNKLEQAVRAEQIEQWSTKDQILVEYLNRAPFGGNLVGAGAAGLRYFGRPCRDLSLGEAALLAGLPQSPNRLRPDRHPQAARARRNHVLDRMLACGMIDAKQHDEAAAEPITVVWHPLPQEEKLGAMPAFSRLATEYQGRVVRTTLDLTIQRQTAAMAREQLQPLAASGITAAAVVVVDTPSGECLAAVSISRPAGSEIANLKSENSDSVHPNPPPEYREKGPENSEGEIDLTRAPRSTGSTLKPLIYAAAFDAGICSPKTTLLDSPAAWPGYSPGNYDRTFRGPMAAADALAESRNIPALLVLARVGVERALGVMDSFGLRTLARAKHPYGLSLAIGGAEASPLEIAEAYATLGRGGIWRPVGLVKSDAGGTRVMRADPCWQTLAAISSAERTTRIAPEAAALRAAWKTGTSSGHRDAWCAAVTPRRTVVVWFGNPAGQGAASLVGQDVAAPLALRLIASLDGGGRGWPDVGEEKFVASLPSMKPIAARSTSSLLIVSPTRGQEILFSPDLTPDQQQVELEVSAAGVGGVWWFVDEEPAGREQKVWWSPTVGEHQIHVVDGGGHSASVNIHVQSPVISRR